MRDIRLWRLVIEAMGTLGTFEAAEARPSADSKELATLLGELAARPKAERWPFLASAARLAAESADPAVRSAAVAVTAGAGGHGAIKAQVAAMADTEPGVRLAAVTALAETCVGDPPRWLHALLHPSAEVRRLAVSPAVQEKLPADARALTPLLLADPANVADALRVLPPQIAPRAVPTVLRAVREGTLSDREPARQIVWSAGWNGIDAAVAATGPSRRWTELAALLRNAGSAKEPAEVAALVASGAAGDDSLDAVMDLLWDAPALGSPTVTPMGVLWGPLFAVVFKAAKGRYLGAMIATAARRGSWNADAAGFCAVLWPEFLRWRWVPGEVRRAAVEGFGKLAGRHRRRGPAFLRRWLERPGSRRPSGAVDLRTLAGLASLLRSETYKWLNSLLPAERVAEAFADDPDGSALYFCLPDEPAGARKALLDEVAKRSGRDRPALLALMVHPVAVGKLDFLDGLQGPEAAAVLAALLRQSRRPGVPALPADKVQRIAKALTPSIAAAGKSAVGPFAEAVAADPDPKSHALVSALLPAVAAEAGAAPFLPAVKSMPTPELLRFLAAVGRNRGIPYGVESALAHAVADHPDRDVRDWAVSRMPAAPGDTPAPASTPAASRPAVVTLTAAARERIATCPDAELPDALRPALAGRASGLCKALARRPTPPMPSIDACAALLGSADSADQVAAQFARFSADTPAFAAELHRRVCERWTEEAALGEWGRVWLHAWERFGLSLGDDWLAREGGLTGALRTALRCPSRLLGRRAWEAAAGLLPVWAARSPEKFAAAATEDLARLAANHLADPVGRPAARMLVTLAHAVLPGLAAVMPSLRARATARLPDAPAEVRDVLAEWLDTRGLAEPTVDRRGRPAEAAPPPPTEPPTEADALDAAEATLKSDGATVAARHDAVLRLIEAGPGGLHRLAALLPARELPLPSAAVIAESVSLWPAGPWLDDVSLVVADASAPAEVRFAAGVGLLEHGRRDVLPHVFDAAAQPLRSGEPPWFTGRDWERLIAHAGATPDTALALAASPQANAYRPAVELLLAPGVPPEPAMLGLAAFLEAGADRLRPLRVTAARRLAELGDLRGLPVLLTAAFEAPNLSADPVAARTLVNLEPEAVAHAVTSALLAGPQQASEDRLTELLAMPGVHPVARVWASRRILRDAALDKTRTAALDRIRDSPARWGKLRTLAETFAWGVPTARRLLGKLMTVEMTSGALGYTRLNEDRVFVTPLPILRGEEDGREVVRGLIVHELGHHRYHKGPVAEKVWKDAQTRGMHGLLNLVSDEHLERNLRALDGDFGDDLKKLAAYAFQHTEKEIAADALLRTLGSRAFEVLTGAPPSVARKKGHVRIHNGHVLMEMERAGFSFPRFVRALRMGLGDRHGDAKVRAGLDLFGKGFRRSTMPQLMAVAERLRDIFGAETAMIESLGQDAVLTPDGSELLADGEGIGRGELQAEVDRVLSGDSGSVMPTRPGRSGQSGRSGRCGDRMNVGTSTDFHRIKNVIVVPYDAARHRAIAAQVGRPAKRMRSVLERLGLSMVRQRFRTSGKSLDRARIAPMVLRGEPRVLLARKTTVYVDLFLGLIVDCSGSMASQGRMERAKLFAVMLAEAARGLRGIDVRVFGFTDAKIFDCGDSARCAASGLRADGGNNDAAGLWHAAQEAAASRRKAKLLVMISDGAPTECTASALKNLVQRLTRREGISCAQVAVAKMSVICFPDHILVEEQEIGPAVRRFGRVIAKLVGKALARG
jgi:hypothetical protein